MQTIVGLTPISDHQVLSQLVSDSAHLFADEEQDLPRALDGVEELVPPDRWGWVKQQILKLVFVARSSSDGVLVLDANTIHLQPRVWLHGQGKNSGGST